MEKDTKGDAGVKKEACEMCRENLLGKIQNAEKTISAVDGVNTKRLDAHSEEIKQLSKLSIEVAGSNKQLIAMIDLLTKNLETQERRIIKLEDRAAEPKKAWYESDIGKWVIKASVIIFFLILAAAVGKGFIEAIKPVTQALPK